MFEFYRNPDTPCLYTVGSFSLPEVSVVRCLVRRFCRCWLRVSNCELDAMEPLFANLGMHYTPHGDARYHAAALHAPSDAHCTDLVPPLDELTLVAAGNGILVLRGYERVDERAFVQEWHY